MMNSQENFVGTVFGDHFAATSSPTTWHDKISSALARIRYQFVIGVMIAVFLPALIRVEFERFADLPSSYTNSVIGCILAFSLGFVIFRKLTAYPGVRAMAYVVPAFTASYMVLVLLFFIMRLDYSRYQTLVSFIVSTSWFLTAFFVGHRTKKIELSVIPGGTVNKLLPRGAVLWRLLQSPADAEGSRSPLVVDLRAELGPEWERFVADAAVSGRPVYHVKQIAESLSGQVEVEHISENTFGSLSPSSLYGSAKRNIDVLTSVFALVALSPFLLLLALAIRLDSPGPAIFRQKRMGAGGKEFVIFKFRSMRNLTAEERAHPDSDTTHDSNRITRIGRIIRVTRLDELPQIVNILRGEMSWIGPRPESLRLSKMYEQEIQYYRYRHVVRPGITGWAQVNQGHVTGVEDASEKFKYDLFYIKHFSLWLDMLVVLRTIRVILTGSGAR
ncbi:MAG: sugar transferase [Pseudomonadota bacterium]